MNVYLVTVDEIRRGFWGPKFRRVEERTFTYLDDLEEFLGPYQLATLQAEQSGSKRARSYRWTIHDGYGGVPHYRPRPKVAPRGGPGPGDIPIRDPHDAERAAAAWMRHWGWEDAQELPVGPDGGIDILATDAIAQVKAHMKPIGRPDIQNLYGVATAQKKTPLFFSLKGYTVGAEEWANDTGVALFTFDLQGRPEATNGHAFDAIRQASAANSRAEGPPEEA